MLWISNSCIYKMSFTKLCQNQRQKLPQSLKSNSLKRVNSLINFSTSALQGSSLDHLFVYLAAYHFYDIKY